MKLAPFGLGYSLYRGNLHGHSTHSDGLLSPKAVVEKYADLGYDFTCLSDHLWIDDRFAATSVFDGHALDRKAFITLHSAELHCFGKTYDQDGLWHIVANGLPLDFACPDGQETAPQLIARAQAAGIDPADVVFSGVGKTDDDIRQALACGIGQINAESIPEVTAISAIAATMGVVAPVALRVNVDVNPGTHAKISTGQRDTKFGISTDQREASDLYRVLCDDPHIRPAGLAVHIGSQIRNLAPFEAAYSALLTLANELRNAGMPVPNLDLGGGVGVDYDMAGPTDFTAYGKLVERLFKDQGFTLGFEPGRAIIANNGVLVTKVIYVKQGDNKRFVIVDAAMNDLLRPTLYEAHHAIWPIAAPQPSIGKADIVGPVCETGDYLGLDRDMPDLTNGDALAVMSAGAYGAVMASSYNSRSPAAEVMILDGKAHLLRGARPIAEMINDESIPDFTAMAKN